MRHANRTPPSYRRYIGTAITVWKTACGGVSIAAMTDTAIRGTIGIRFFRHPCPLLFGVMIEVDPQLGAFSVSGLRQRPEFFDTISRRVWDAWWKQRGVPLKYITGRLREHLGAALIDHAAQSAFAVGIGRVFLCAIRSNRDFYLKRGWTKIEEEVGQDLLSVMVRDRP
jgi:hypothetical protein